MTNLLTVLPDFDVAPYSHILPSLERAAITTADLVTLDALDVAKRAQVPPGEVKKLTETLLDALHKTADFGRPADDTPDIDGWRGFRNVAQALSTRRVLSTLDDALDQALGGGIAAGHLTEIVGESAAGKTQFLLTLLLSAQLVETKSNQAQPRPSALYLSTEAPLQTTRLAQILKTHPRLVELPSTQKPSLNRVHSTHVHDIEAQEHILRFQVPVAIQKHNVSLLVVDSIAANYRAEFDKGGQSRRNLEALAQRSTQLAQLGSLLRDLARTYNIAVVVANQVADRFTTIDPIIPSQHTTQPGTPSQQQTITYPSAPSLPPPSSSTSQISTPDPLSIDHQQRFFTGWGDDPRRHTNLKTPSLGLTWTNQLATRIALLKEPLYDDTWNYAPGEEREIRGWKRDCKVVFSASGAKEGNVGFEIWEGGIRSAVEGRESVTEGHS